MRSGRWKDLQIIALRHENAGLRRQIGRPSLTDDDRSDPVDVTASSTNTETPHDQPQPTLRAAHHQLASNRQPETPVPCQFSMIPSRDSLIAHNQIAEPVSGLHSPGSGLEPVRPPAKLGQLPAARSDLDPPRLAQAHTQARTRLIDACASLNLDQRFDQVFDTAPIIFIEHLEPQQ